MIQRMRMVIRGGVCGAALVLVPTAFGQAGAATPGATPAQIAVGNAGNAVASSGIPQRDTLAKLMRPIVVEFKDQRLEDVFAFIGSTTGADLAVFWADDSGEGLNKDMLITLKSRGRSGLDIIEAVIKKIDMSGEITGGSQWQMADSGEIEIGPKARLNATTRLELYPIKDLLTDVPDFVDAPSFDLNSVLSGANGGGGGQSPFQSQGSTSALTTTSDIEKADQLIAIVVKSIESEQWEQNAGTGATIQYYQGSLMVKGPDYIHRQLGGYPYWPSEEVAAGGATMQRRYVNLSTTTQFAEPLGFRTVPVTGVAGGGGKVPGGG
jgi:hypothetical protein